MEDDIDDAEESDKFDADDIDNYKFKKSTQKDE